MTTQSPFMPKAWISTLVLTGMGVLATATTCLAQGHHSLVNRDAVRVTIDDEVKKPSVSKPSASKVSQVGFFDLGKKKSSCNGCGKSAQSCCCAPWWAHRKGFFGEFFVIRPGNADQIYTVEQNSVVPGDNPTGPVGRINIDAQPAYRVGFSWCASPGTSLVGSYSRFENTASSAITPNGTNVLSSLVIHPSTQTVGAAGLGASANYSMDYQLYDLAYRHIWKSCDTYAINWLAGIRYGTMDQDLLVRQDISVATGLVSVDTDIDFDGFGMTFGLDGERRSPCTGLMVYGRALSSFLAGDWDATYVQTNQFGGGVVANQYKDYRITPVLELELGLGWRSKCNKYRASIGYMNSAWYDSVSTRTYIDSVRSNNYVSIDETITFSGLTSRFEVNF